MSLPFRLINRLTFLGVTIVSILIAHSTSYGLLAKIVIAYVAFELIFLFIGTPIYAAVGWVLRRFFFFLIDVVPAHGADAEEAKAIVKMGRAFELLKKFETEIENWTREDTKELVSKMNWRVRLFFPVGERMEVTVNELKRIQEQTGQQPRDLGEAGLAKIRKGLPEGNVSAIEKAITDQRIFNSIFALAIIIITIGYMPS